MHTQPTLSSETSVAPTTANTDDKNEQKELKGYSNLSTIEFEIFQKLVQQSFNQLEDTKDKNIALFIGRTGAGKSTLINYMLGRKMHLIGNTSDTQDRIVVAEGEDVASVIGHSMSSQTLYPNSLTSLFNKDLVYVDCPGFNGNRPEEITACEAVSTQLAIQAAKNIHAVITVVNYGDIVNKGEGLKLLIDSLKFYLKSPTQFQESLVFVYTHVPERRNASSIATALSDLARYVGESKLAFTNKARAVAIHDNTQFEEYKSKIDELILSESIIKIMRDRLEKHSLVITHDILHSDITNLSSKGECRKMIESLISNAMVKSIAPSAFNFIDADTQNKLKTIANGIVSKGYKFLGTLKDTPAKITSLKEDAGLLGDNISSLKRTIALNENISEADIDAHRKLLEKAKEKQKVLDSDYIALVLKLEEVNAEREYLLKHVLDSVFFEKFNADSSYKNIWGLKKINKTFVYLNNEKISLGEAEIKLDPEENFTRIELISDQGSYKAVYESNRFENASATVSIKALRPKIPGNIVRVDQINTVDEPKLKIDIADKKMQLDDLNSLIASNEAIIKSLEAFKSNSQPVEQSAKEKLQKLTNELKEREKKLANNQTLIQMNNEALNRAKQEFYARNRSIVGCYNFYLVTNANANQITSMLDGKQISGISIIMSRNSASEDAVYLGIQSQNCQQLFKLKKQELSEREQKFLNDNFTQMNQGPDVKLQAIATVNNQLLQNLIGTFVFYSYNTLVEFIYNLAAVIDFKDSGIVSSFQPFRELPAVSLEDLDLEPVIHEEKEQKQPTNTAPAGAEAKVSTLQSEIETFSRKKLKSVANMPKDHSKSFFGKLKSQVDDFLKHKVTSRRPAIAEDEEKAPQQCVITAFAGSLSNKFAEENSAKKDAAQQQQAAQQAQGNQNEGDALEAKSAGHAI